MKCSQKSWDSQNTPPKVNIDVRETLQLDRRIRWSLPGCYKSDVMFSQSIFNTVLSREKEGNEFFWKQSAFLASTNENVQKSSYRWSPE